MRTGEMWCVMRELTGTAMRAAPLVDGLREVNTAVLLEHHLPREIVVAVGERLEEMTAWMREAKRRLRTVDPGL